MSFCPASRPHCGPQVAFPACTVPVQNVRPSGNACRCLGMKARVNGGFTSRSKCACAACWETCWRILNMKVRLPLLSLSLSLPPPPPFLPPPHPPTPHAHTHCIQLPMCTPHTRAHTRTHTRTHTQTHTHTHTHSITHTNIHAHTHSVTQTHTHTHTHTPDGLPPVSYTHLTLPTNHRV